MSLVLKELEIIKHPLLKTEGKLTFSDGINLLVGKNGSGKTQLLEFITKCTALDFRGTQKTNFEVKMKLHQVRDNINVKIHYSQSIKSTDLGFPSGQNAILNNLKIPDYKQNTVDFCNIDIEQRKTKSVKILVNGSRVSYKTHKGTNKFIDFDNSLNDYFPRLFTAMMSLPGEFKDLGFRLFTEMVFSEPELFNEDNKYYDDVFNNDLIVHFESDNAEEPYFRELNSDSYKNKLLKRYMDDIILAHPSYGELSKTIIEISNKNNPTINQICKQLGYKKMVIKSLEPSRTISNETDGIVLAWNLRNHSFKIDIDIDTSIYYDDLSYGEKRYLLLLLYLDVNDSVLMDEPINGLHHSMIEDLVERLSTGKKQSFIANQSPVLFDYVEFSSKEQVLEKLVVCRKDKDKKLLFSNPTKEMADGFYKDYERNFLQVSEILKHQEIW